MKSYVRRCYSNNNIPKRIPLPKSEVFYNLTEIRPFTQTLKKHSNENVTSSCSHNAFLLNEPDYPSSSTEYSVILKQASNNESLKRTPSPILLKYCKDLMASYNLMVRPIIFNSEPLLAQEDVALLTQLIDSNKRYKCLNDKDTALLKKILDLNTSKLAYEKKELCIIVDEYEEGGGISCDDTIEINFNSETNLLETLPTNKVNDSDELMLSCQIVEELFKRNDNPVLDGNSVISLLEMEDHKDTVLNLESNVSESFPVDTPFECLLNVENDDEEETWETNTIVGSIPVPNDLLTAKETIIVTPTNYTSPLAIIDRKVSTNFESNNINYSNLYTAPEYIATENKLLNEITARLTTNLNLPMSLSVKIIEQLDIKKRKHEFYAIQLRESQVQAYSYKRSVITSSCEEYEIKLLTFEEMLRVEHFYEINPNSNEIERQPTNVSELTTNPEKLLKMLKPPKATTIPGKLLSKIRIFFDEEKYKHLFDDQSQLDLYSAKSFSSASQMYLAFDDDEYGCLCSTRSRTSGPNNAQNNDEDMTELSDLWSEENIKSNRVGILFDSEINDQLYTSRSQASEKDKAIFDQDCEADDTKQSKLFVLDDFSKIDPLTIGEFCDYLRNTYLRDATQQLTSSNECDVESFQDVKMCQSSSFCSISSSFLSAHNIDPVKVV